MKTQEAEHKHISAFFFESKSKQKFIVKWKVFFFF